MRFDFDLAALSTAEVEVAEVVATAFFLPLAAAVDGVEVPDFFAAAADDPLVAGALPLTEEESAIVELEEDAVPSSAGLAGGSGLADLLLPIPSPRPWVPDDGPSDECG